jgi:hypothetical protein
MSVNIFLTFRYRLCWYSSIPSFRRALDQRLELRSATIGTFLSQLRSSCTQQSGARRQKSWTGWLDNKCVRESRGSHCNAKGLLVESGTRNEAKKAAFEGYLKSKRVPSRNSILECLANQSVAGPLFGSHTCAQAHQPLGPVDSLTATQVPNLLLARRAGQM